MTDEKIIQQFMKNLKNHAHFDDESIAFNKFIFTGQEDKVDECLKKMENIKGNCKKAEKQRRNLAKQYIN